MKKVKFVNWILLLFVSVIVGVNTISAQSSCSCSLPNGCSQSQTCPAGYIAVCTCSATGCSAQCVKEDRPPIFDFSESSVASRLQNEPIENIGGFLSKTFGKIVTFEPTNSKFKFEYSSSDLSTSTHWGILEYLAKNGILKINGHNLEFWQGLRRTLLKGGEFTFCTGSATSEMILGEISFITGKKYSIVSGNPKGKIQGEIKGNSLNEILDNLSKAGQITITEN